MHTSGLLDCRWRRSSTSNISSFYLPDDNSVCAGDYGDTTFHGVNEILVYGDSITASVAKLNEYYLASATEARKQYTMCHGK
jgi:hypothetical protein